MCARVWFCAEREIRECVQSTAYCDKPTRCTSVKDNEGNDRGSESCPWK